MKLIMVTVAMSAMMRNNPTSKTTLQVTMSMMTTMTTVLHQEIGIFRKIGQVYIFN